MQTNESELSRKSHHQSASARRAAKTDKAEARRAEVEEKKAARTKDKAAKAPVTKEAMAAINRLDAIGKEITAKLILHDKARVKADDMLVSVNVLLKEAEKLCADNAACGSMMSFATFKTKVCPSLGRSAAYEVRAILLGKKTKEELALSNRTRQAKHQAKVRAERTVREAENADGPLYNGRPDPNVGMPPGPKLALLPDNSVVVTGNVDTEASAEARNAAAESWATEAPKPNVTTYTDSRAAKSKRAFNTIMSTLDDYLPEMTSDDKSEAYIRFVRHPEMIGIKREEA